MPKTKDNINRSKKMDLTRELRSLQEEITRLKRELVDKEWASRKTNEGIKVLYKELEKKNKQLQKLDQLKSNFVATVSHELRTPLSITKEGVSLVLDEVTGKINEKQRHILKMSKDNIDRLTGIINDLLDISKIEAGTIELKKVLVDFSNIVKDICIRWKLEFDKKRQEIRVSLPKNAVNIYVDHEKVIQILNNLISNAIKYTPQNGKISIELKDKKDQVEVIVADSGIGISEEDLPKVFGKFQQFGRIAGPGAKGTGLGLAITKELVEMHKGTIRLESELNKGSKFIFSIPKMDFEAVLKEYINSGTREAIEKKTQLSLVAIQIVGFKQFQKQLGYDKSYSLLKDIEKVINDSLRRQADIVIRDTGEFIILLFDTNREDVVVVRRRIEEVIKGFLSKGKESWLSKISINIGNATYPEEAANDEELLNKARTTLQTRAN